MDEMRKTKIIVIVGPTASGKTALSIKIAKKFAGEIISADSRQIYKKLNIGTEKVTSEEMDGVPHHLLDVVDIDTVYNASDFKNDAEEAIQDISDRNHLPIIAGGTFFYIDTLLGKIVTPPVIPNIELRKQLSQMSIDDLYVKLKQTDPRRALSIDRQNKRRLIRALEITNELGKVPPNKEVQLTCNYDVLTIGIETDKIKLRARLRERASDALTKGLIEETKGLLASGVSKERLSEIGLEYRIILEYLNGNLNDEQLIQKLEEKNWQYAKRQLMWLKRDKSIKWFERKDCKAIFTLVSEFIS